MPAYATPAHLAIADGLSSLSKTHAFAREITETTWSRVLCRASVRHTDPPLEGATLSSPVFRLVRIAVPHASGRLGREESGTRVVMNAGP